MAAELTQPPRAAAQREEGKNAVHGLSPGDREGYHCIGVGRHGHNRALDYLQHENHAHTFIVVHEVQRPKADAQAGPQAFTYLPPDVAMTTRDLYDHEYALVLVPAADDPAYWLRGVMGQKDRHADWHLGVFQGFFCDADTVAVQRGACRAALDE
jgi:hypothetical protein